MKWLGGIINALVIALLTATLAAVLTPWLRSAFPDEVLDAEIEIARWSEKPTKPGVVKEKVEPISKLSWERDEWFNQAYINISNETSKTIDGARIRFVGYERPTVLILADDGSTKTTLVDVTDVRLPVFKPGDHVKMYIWFDGLGVSPLLFPKSFKTYSSVGPFRRSIAFPEAKEFYKEPSPVFDFLDDWIGYIVIVLALLLVGAIYAFAHGLDAYIKKILDNRTFYNSERKRYLANPQKFEVDMTQ